MDERPEHRSVIIERANLDSAIAHELIGELNAELSRQYPEEGACHFRLDPQEVTDGRGAFLVVWRGGKPIGCGAVRRIDAQTGELKRMYVREEARGAGVGRALLEMLESEARTLGLARLVLETGTRQEAAMSLYLRAGFTEIDAWGEYVDSPLSVCMGKDL